MEIKKMFKYQREFIKFVNEQLGYKAFRRDDFADFLFRVPQQDKEQFYNDFRVVKGWSEKELKEKLF